MIDVVRVWRFLRVLRKHRFSSNQDVGMQNLLLEDAIAKLAYQVTFFGLGWRRYGTLRAANAYYMAKAHDYIWIDNEKKKFEKRNIGLNSTGLRLSSHSALINELSKQIASVSALVAVIISAIALYISIKNT